MIELRVQKWTHITMINWVSARVLRPFNGERTIFWQSWDKWKSIFKAWIFYSKSKPTQNHLLTLLLRGDIWAKVKERIFSIEQSFQQHAHWRSHYRWLCPGFHKVNHLQELWITQSHFTPLDSIYYKVQTPSNFLVPCQEWKAEHLLLN